MTHTGIALLGYIAWTIFLLACLATYRTAVAQSKKSGSLKFSADGSDVGGFGERLTRAQANCSESFIFIGGVLLYALATNNMVITDGLAIVLLLARIAQSIVHLVSITNLAIKIRFVLFLVQVGISVFWIYRFLSI